MRIETCLRIKPTTAASTITQLSDTSIQLESYAAGTMSFGTVFDCTRTNKDIFKTSVEPLLRQLVRTDSDLRSACLAAYGVSNSGKTHTFYGDGDTLGLLPLSLEWIFEYLKPVRETNFRPSSRYCQVETIQESAGAEEGWSVWVSAVEVYNDAVFDILNEKKQVLMLKHASGTTHLDPLSTTQMQSIEQALATIQSVRQRRQVNGTQLNASSSRSHLILYLNLVRGTMVKRLVLVDLAGTERQKHTQAGQDRLKETGWIHQSLSSLRHCLIELKERRPYVSFRNSKLTQVLQPDLQPPLSKDSPQTQTVFKFFVMVDPSEKYRDETLHSLETACFASKVDIKHISARIDTGMGMSPHRAVTALASPRVFDGLKRKLFQSPVLPITNQQIDQVQVHTLPASFEEEEEETVSSDDDDSFIQDMARRDMDARQQMLDDHARQIEWLQQEHEQMFMNGMRDAEEKSNRKLEIMERQQNAELAEKQAEIDRLNKEILGLREENSELIIKLAQVPSGAVDFENELTRHLQEIMQNSQRQMMDLETQMRKEVKAVKDHYQSREKDRQLEVVALKQELEQLRKAPRESTTFGNVSPINGKETSMSPSKENVEPKQFSPMLSHQGHLRAAFKVIAAEKTAPLKRKKKLRQRRAVFGDDDEDSD
jgi:hypothetical protein